MDQHPTNRRAERAKARRRILMEESDHAFLTLASTAAAKNPITTAKAIKEELIQRYMEAWMSKATIVNRRLAVFFSYGLNVVDGIRIKPSEKGLAIYHGDGKYLYIPAAGDREIVDCALQAWAPIVNALLQTPGSVAELHRVIDEEIEKEGWQIFLRDGQALDTMKFQGKIELCAQGRMARKQLNALKLKDPNIPEHIYDPQSDTFKVAYYSITIHGDLDLTWHTFSWQTSPMEFRDYFPRLEDPKYCKRALANAGRRLMRLRDRQGMSSVVATLTQELDLEIERAKPKNSMIPLHVEVPFLRSWCDSDTPSVVSETPSVSSEGWLPMPSPDNFMAMVEGIRMVHKWPLIVVPWQRRLAIFYRILKDCEGVQNARDLEVTDVRGASPVDDGSEVSDSAETELITSPEGKPGEPHATENDLWGTLAIPC